MRFITIILLTYSLLSISSCNKARECECRKQGESAVNVSYSIKERNKKKAVEKCKTYSELPENQNKYLTCTIRLD